MGIVKNHLHLKPLAKQKYFELGPSRTLKKLHAVLVSLVPNPPSWQTLRGWSQDEFWRAEAELADLEAFKKIQQPLEPLPFSPEGIQKRQEEVFHAKTEYNKAAAGFLRIVNQWTSKETITEVELKQASNIVTMLDGAIKATKMVEVLEGRVSDRTAEEKTITAEDNRKKADESAEDLIAHCVMVSTKMRAANETIQ